MTICKCKKCKKIIISTVHIEDKKNALCYNCWIKQKKQKAEKDGKSLNRSPLRVKREDEK